MAQATLSGTATDGSQVGKVGIAAPSGRYVADDPRQWIGKPSVGTGECVPLVQAATGAPDSTHWRPGDLVKGNANIRPGTAIATFDRNGRYVGHAAIYLGQDEHDIQVIDQWNNRDGDGRLKSRKTPKRANTAIRPSGSFACQSR
jgi:hypothetical protein